MFSLQQNPRTRGQNRFCLEAGEGGGDPNNVFTCEIKKRRRKEIVAQIEGEGPGMRSKYIAMCHFSPPSQLAESPISHNIISHTAQQWPQTIFELISPGNHSQLIKTVHKKTYFTTLES
jgi:hypothetical protein